MCNSHPEKDESIFSFFDKEKGFSVRKSIWKDTSVQVNLEGSFRSRAQALIYLSIPFGYETFIEN